MEASLISLRAELDNINEEIYSGLIVLDVQRDELNKLLNKLKAIILELDLFEW